MERYFQKILIIIGTILLVIGSISYASGNFSNELNQKLSKAIVLHIESSKAFVNGEEKLVDSTNNTVYPIIKDGRTLVPVRFISENLNATVNWNQAARTAEIDYQGYNIKITVGSNIIKVNGHDKQIDVPAQIINSRTYIPLRALVEALNKKVFWDNGLIVISDDENLFNYKYQLVKELKDAYSLYSEIKYVEFNDGNVSFEYPDGLLVMTAPEGAYSNNDGMFLSKWGSGHEGAIDGINFEIRYSPYVNFSEKKFDSTDFDGIIKALNDDKEYKSYNKSKLENGVLVSYEEDGTTRIALFGRSMNEVVPTLHIWLNKSNNFELQKQRYSEVVDHMIKSFKTVSYIGKEATLEDIEDNYTRKENLNNKGNSAGNISNVGLAAIRGKYIYYSADSKLIKISKDNTEKHILSNDDSHYINVLGDWIYYQNISDNGRLYKIKTDGTGRFRLNNEYSADINVQGDWIYFRKKVDQYNYALFKMKTDGSSLMQMSENACNGINVIDNTIYYTRNGLGLVSISTEGENEKIFEKFDGYNMVVSGEWVYYTSPKDSLMYKMKIDGSYNVKLFDDPAFNVNIVGDVIYYVKGAIYKIKKDGSGETQIIDNSPEVINVVGDWIYYAVYDDYDSNENEKIRYKLYRIKTDGNNNELLGNTYNLFDR